MSSPAPLWFYTDGFSTYGPFDSSAIRQLKAAGVIRAAHTLRRQGDDTPLPLSAVDEPIPQPAIAPPPLATPVELPFQLVRNGTNHGAFSLSELKEKLRLQQVTPNDLVWREGMSDWTTIALVPELRPATSLPPAMPTHAKSAETTNPVAIVGIAVVVIGFLIVTTRFWIDHPGFLLLIIAAGCLKAFGKSVFKKF